MAKPQEFTITIRPDGRIVLDAPGMHETSYRRILEFLAETVGPVKAVEVEPGEPPERRVQASAQEENRPEVKMGE